MKLSEKLMVKIEPYLDDHNSALALEHLQKNYDSRFDPHREFDLNDLKKDLEHAGVKFSVSLTF
jgi:hypothetical protein